MGYRLGSCDGGTGGTAVTEAGGGGVSLCVGCRHTRIQTDGRVARMRDDDELTSRDGGQLRPAGLQQQM